MTREQSVPQPDIGGMARGTLAAAFTALRPLNHMPNKNRQRRHGADRQGEQQHRFHNKSPKAIRWATYHFRYSHSTVVPVQNETLRATVAVAIMTSTLD